MTTPVITAVPTSTQSDSSIPRPAVHLAIPVNDLAAARRFYGQVLGLVEGRSTDHWVDWDFHGHQLVTHLVATASAPTGTSQVEAHTVPIPHFGLLLDTDGFHDTAARVREAGVMFDVAPHLRFAGQPSEQWTMFFRDPAGNTLEFKAFRDEAMVFAR